MTSSQFVSILVCLVLGVLGQTVNLTSSSSVRHERRETGGNLTLQCVCKENSFPRTFWFKQTLAEKPRPISSIGTYGADKSFFGEFKNNPRFTLDSQKGRNDLTISDLQASDSAIYHCIGSDISVLEILETIRVSVKGSGVSVPALVHQSESETIQPGDSVTLNCTVHTGTYDCTVVSCGAGTKLDSGDEVSSGVLVYSLSGALIFQTVLIVVLVLRNKRISRISDESSSSKTAEDYENLNVSKRRRQRDVTWSECVYHTLRK